MFELLGLPFDHNSSFLRGSAQAPGRIREALLCGASNLCAEDGTDLAGRYQDLGDLADFGDILEVARKREGGPLLSLGGDHSVSYPLIRAHSELYPELTVVQFDAHPDLYPEYEGNRDSHACPFARLLEEGCIKNLVQIGIRTQNPVQKEVALRHQVRQVEMASLEDDFKLELEGPLYLSLDLDVLDPAFAPGVSHHEPGGLSTRRLLNLLHDLEGAVGADIVEYNPMRDPTGVTGAVAAKLLKEVATLLLRQ